MSRIALLVLAVASVSLYAGEKHLFNGKDMNGWRHVGPGRSSIWKTRCFVTEGGMGLLVYDGQKFGNTKIKVVFKTTGPTDNAGVYIRRPEKPMDSLVMGVHNGYEVQIDAAGDEWHCTGAIYSLSKVTERTQKPAGEWNTMIIDLKGQTTIVTLNGTKIDEFRRRSDCARTQAVV